MAGAAAVGGVALSALSLQEQKKARKEAKKETRRLEAKQKKLTEEEAQEKFRAKRSEYEASRSLMRRGAARGRASTVLDRRDTVG